MGTGCIDSFVVLDGGLGGLAEGTDFAGITPEAIVSGVLLLYKLVIVNVGGEVGMGLCSVTVLGDLPKGASEFVFASFSGDVATVTGHLCSWIGLTHDNFITSNDAL